MTKTITNWVSTLFSSKRAHPIRIAVPAWRLAGINFDAPEPIVYDTTSREEIEALFANDLKPASVEVTLTLVEMEEEETLVRLRDALYEPIDGDDRQAA